MQHEPSIVIGVVLAGGKSRRYGIDKAFVPFQGLTLIKHVMGRAAPQVDKLLISANDEARFAHFGFPVLADTITENDGGQAGPLAGILAALDWITLHEPQARWLASFSVDTPLLPADMVPRLRAAAEREGRVVACSRSAGRLHPLLALWSPAIRDSLRAALARGERAAHRFAEERGAAVVEFADQPCDPFANINTPDDLARLAARSADQP
jgi:molybdopterin-guanine dinucleotide biosynthesis protein A